MADFSLIQTVLGFDVVEEPLLFVLRHRRSLALADLEGDVKCCWPQQQDGEDLCSAVALPMLDAVASLDSGGSLRLAGYVENEALNVWDLSLGHLVGPYGWGRLEASAENQAVLRAAGRRGVALFDTRSSSGRAVEVFRPDCLGTSGRKPSSWRHMELMAGMAGRPGSSRQFYCATNDRLVLLDERMASSSSAEQERPVVRSWAHGIGGSIPSGCEAAGDFVALYGSDGSLSLMQDGEESSSLRRVPNLVTTLASLSLGGDIPPRIGFELMDAPWTGIALLPHAKGRVGCPSSAGVVSLNEAGIMLHCRVTARLDEAMDDLASVDSQESLLEEGDHFVKPGQATSSSFTRFSRKQQRQQDVISSSELTSARESWREWNARVEREVRYKKAPLASSVLKRKRRNAPSARSRSIPEVRPFSRKLVKELLGPGPPRKWKERIREKGEEIHFSAIPSLKPLDPNLHDDKAGKKVIQIIEGEECVFPHLTGSASDTSTFRPVSFLRDRSGTTRMRKRTRSGGSSSTVASSSVATGVRAPEVPRDTSYTMESFLSGLDPFMTSTQEDRGSIMPPPPAPPSMGGSQDTQSQRADEWFTDSQQTQSQSQSQQKSSKKAKKAGVKKRKSVVGF